MKKVIFVFFIIVIIMSLHGCKDKKSINTYKNTKYNFTFKIPETWENKFDIIEENNSISFIYTEHRNVKNEYEPFFSIIIKDLSQYEKKSEQEYSQDMLLGSNDKYIFIYDRPLDMGFSNSDKENNLVELSLSYEEIKERIDIKD